MTSEQYDRLKNALGKYELLQARRKELDRFIAKVEEVISSGELVSTCVDLDRHGCAYGASIRVTEDSAERLAQAIKSWAYSEIEVIEKQMEDL